MNIIAVDDERLAIVSLERAIKDAIPDCNLACFDISVDALEYAQSNPIDVAFLDVNMPEMNGLELAEKLMELYENINIIFVTGYMEYGADATNLHASGYLMKPINTEKVLASMANLRKPINGNGTEKTIVRGKIKLDVIAIQAFIDGKDLQLQPKEFAVLLLLVNNEGKLMSAEDIYENVWGQPMGNDKNALHKAMSGLRKKIDSDSGYVIHSEYMKGYIFERICNK